MRQQKIDDRYSNWMTERKCPMCGRTFFARNSEEWVYKHNGKLYCRYNCKRAAEKGTEKPKEEDKPKIAETCTNSRQREGVIRWYINLGLSNAEIERETGFSMQMVNYYRRKMEKSVKG